MLLQNRYVFNPFWQHHNGIGCFEDWEERFNASARGFAQSLEAQDTVRVLSFVFDRLDVSATSSCMAARPGTVP
jgi:hypothetical protein